MKSKRKNEIFYFIVLILTLITMCIGITFTYFNLLAQEEKDSTKIQTGTLAINYIDGMEIDSSELIPINEPNLNSTSSVTKKNFSIRSTGTLDQTLDIYIKVTENNFANNSLRFAIYDSDTSTKISSGYITNVKDSKILMATGVPLKSNNTKNFTVLIWLQENNQNQNYEQGKTFIGGFDITANQMIYK